MRSFVKIKPSRIGDITLSFTDIGKSCPVRDFLRRKCVFSTLLAKMKFSRKFPNLQYQLCVAYRIRCRIESEFGSNPDAI